MSLFWLPRTYRKNNLFNTQRGVAKCGASLGISGSVNDTLMGYSVQVIMSLGNLEIKNV